MVETIQLGDLPVALTRKNVKHVYFQCTHQMGA